MKNLLQRGETFSRLGKAARYVVAATGATIVTTMKDVVSDSSPPEEELVVEHVAHNDLFDVTGNKRRRYMLCALFFHDDAISCRKLAKQVAAWETGTTPDRVTSRQYQSVYNSFSQSHLPTLDETGFIDYDRSEAVVYPTERIEELDPIFRFRLV